LAEEFLTTSLRNHKCESLGDCLHLDRVGRIGRRLLRPRLVIQVKLCRICLHLQELPSVDREVRPIPAVLRLVLKVFVQFRAIVRRDQNYIQQTIAGIRRGSEAEIRADRAGIHGLEQQELTR